MNSRQPILRTLVIASAMTAAAFHVSADDLRNVKRGEPFPTYKLPSIDGTVADSDGSKASVQVIVCLSAEQRRSELAAMESLEVVRALGSAPVRILHVTADVVQKAYFEKFRQERSINTPLAFDADRAFYAKLGLIVFPTTIIVNKDGKLDSVISLHSSDYKNLLDAHVRHAMGTLTDKQLDERLAAHPSEESSPKSAASAHRSLARLMREKGQLDTAKAELTKGLELDPQNREIMLDLADLNLALGDLDGADTALQSVLQAQSDHRRAKLLKGEVLFRRGKLDEAQSVLQDSLALNPSPELAHYFLGRIAETRGEKDKALEHYREALKHFVRDIDPPANPPSPAKESK
jgi:tetratricopeptide (TPR) repeat protein